MRQLIKLKQPRTILCDKWVIGGAEIDEPVPIPKLPQQNRGGVKRVCDHGGSPVRDEIRLLYNPHIPFRFQLNSSYLQNFVNLVPLSHNCKFNPLVMNLIS